MIAYSFIGVDMAKAKFDASTLVNNKAKHRVFENNLPGFKAFLSWIQKLDDPSWVCMEATGHYSELLADYLHSQAIRVSIINPMQIKNFAKVTLKRNKNDILDSRLIAEYGAIMKPKAFVPRSAKQKEIRELIQLMDMLKSQLTQLKNQKTTVQTKSSKTEIQRAITALEKRIEKLNAKIKTAISEDAGFEELVKLLITIKGVGELSAYRILSLLPDISLFDSPKQLAAFMGVTPHQCESGAWQGKTRMSKFGNPRLRKALYMPALSAKNKNEYLRPFVARLESRGLNPKAIVGAVMRKLAHIIFGILKSRQPFNPELFAK